MTEDDLGGWEPTYEPPVAAGYAGYTVFKTGPWGQGPVFLQQLQLLEGFDLKGMGHGTAEYVHVITECAKLAFADREAWYGDPLFVDVPMAALLSKGLCGPAARIGFGRVLARTAPGVSGWSPRPAFRTSAAHRRQVRGDNGKSRGAQPGWGRFRARD